MLDLRLDEQGIGFSSCWTWRTSSFCIIETMRREGFEFEVGRPQVVTKTENDVILEPIEEVIVEVPAEHVGAVQMEFGRRKAQLVDQFSSNKGVTKLVYTMPTRALLGARNILLTATKGTIIMNTLLDSYAPLGAALNQIRNGVLSLGKLV
jgi:GTP-binding protein